MRITPSLLLAFLTVFCKAQVTIIGHNMLNQVPVKYTQVTVKQGNKTLRTFNTQSKSDFRVDLDFGHVYRIYLQTAQCPVMFMEVVANTVPADKYEYRMVYELNVPFVDKRDEDIDTTRFTKAFHRVIFNGKTKMVDDTTYNNTFARNIFKKPEPEPAVAKEQQKSLPSIVAGRISLSGKSRIPLVNKQVFLVRHDGSPLKSTYTNRSGIFVFTDVILSEAGKLRVELTDAMGGSHMVSLLTVSNTLVADARPANGLCEWPLTRAQMFSLVDNHYTSIIGGKLVSSSPKEKKFYAEQNVYLSNRLNTVVKQTKTSKLGTFVFDDIKPDHAYLIGVDRDAIDPGARVDLLNKDDKFIATLDSLVGMRSSVRLNTNHNQRFSDLSVVEEDMKMDVKGTIYGDNVNNPIGKLKILLLNDQYQVIDSAITNDFGTFKFKYLPFLKRFYLSAENNENILDVFKNILIYSSDDNLIKIMTHQKGTKFKYQPVATEMSRLRDIEIADPWLDLLDPDQVLTASANGSASATPRKSIIENILFETARYDITEESKEILDKVILVLYTNKKLRIEIGAHTDAKGSDASNMKLSELRAKTVKDYITAAGISQDRITTRGYGETRLLNDCSDGVPCSEIEHAQNRRIEFKILGETD